MQSIGKDIQFAWRAFRKSPVFTAVALLSLALGIGANTAIFTLLDQVLLRLLPVKNPQELVLLGPRGANYGSNWNDHALSYPMYRDFQANNTVFSGMFCRFEYVFNLGFNGNTERADGELVSGTYFPVLGVGAAMGRTLGPDDDKTPGGHPVAVLSYDYWISRFSGDHSIVGKTVAVNGHNFTVVGVAQQGFAGVDPSDPTKVFLPVMMRAQLLPQFDPFLDLTNRRDHWLNLFGRLKPGVSLEQARASLEPYYHSLLELEVKDGAFSKSSAETRAEFLRGTLEVVSGSQGKSGFRAQLSTPLWVLMALTGGVLLIACANVAGLMIARAASRQKEIAIRVAMGAGRFHIIRQLLMEGLLLAAAGGALGLILAMWTDQALLAFLPPGTSTFRISTTPDLRILLFTAGISLVTAVIFGLMPAIQATKPDVAPVLKDTVGGIVGGGMHVRVRKGLVAAQVMLSLLLLIGAGLFIRSLENLRDMGPGFAIGNLVAFDLDPSLNGYNAERSKLFFRRLNADIGAIPCVLSTGVARVGILEDDNWDSGVTPEGYDGKSVEVYMNSVSPSYFQSLRVPILAGRDFTEQDTQTIQHGDKPTDTAPRVVIVNEKFAKQFYGSAGNAVGRHAGFGGDPGTKTDMEIVGVVKDIKYTNLRTEIPIQMFEPYLADDLATSMTVYARTTMNPDQYFSAVRAKVRALDSNLPVFDMRTMDQQISRSLLVERLIASLSAVFGILATLLAVIGLYGVMAYTVSRRTREIGIRMALGAFQRDVVWMVMREVLLLLAIGLAAGLAGAFVLVQLVKTQLYGVSGHDPLTVVLAALALGAVACAAGYIPALRASRIDAMRALRYE
ncbi:MAG TPA: ABC transporter permease [Bryobacteraceae bacterium]|nr:ABC transporter permease [Bryobacteraceae bacterium]